MKRVEAVIRPERLEAVRQTLLDLGHSGLTVLDAKGHGIQHGISVQWRGTEYTVGFLPKVMIVAVVHDHEARDVVDAIVKAARTGSIGDGKIFVSPVEDAIRVRTGEVGVETI